MQGTFAGTVAWFQRGKERGTPTAAHYNISRTGDVCQMVDDDKKCYHAGNYNSRSIGIEHEVYIGGWPVKTMNGKVKAPPYPADEFPDAMLQASARVVAALCSKYKIPISRGNIIGHSEVPGATHTDPGVLFPWSRYMELVDDAVRQGWK